MRIIQIPRLLLMALLICRAPPHAAEEDLVLPADLATVNDGRATIQQLFTAFGGLLHKGWTLDVITHSQPDDTRHALPIFALRSAKSGRAVWIISGIHGEEPAGPNAIAEVIDDIAKFGERHPVVLIPLANPHGYVRNWRYLNTPQWTDDVDVQSVGDSSHMLPDPEDAQQARAAAPSSPEAGAITRYIFDTMREYPPAVSIDLHEDDTISAGYVYSQGVNGAAETLAIEAVNVLRQNGIPIKLDGYTQFDEEIREGIVGPVIDSSIDELFSATEIIVDGEPRRGPSAAKVLVFETPASDLPLVRRQSAQAAMLRRMMQLISNAPN